MLLATSSRSATEADVPALALALTRAFQEDVFHEWLVPDPERRTRCLPAGFEVMLGHYVRRRECFTDGRLSGAALWAPPGGWKLSPAEQVRMLPGFARAFGMKRLPRILAGFSKLEKHHPDDHPHWYLEIIGVDPQRQGQGAGTALMRPVFDRCDRDGTAAYLETATEGNIPFFERQGFQVREEFDIEGGPHIWTMWREAQPAR